AEDALEREAEALSCASRLRVQGVALPLEAAVAEVVEGMPGQQVDRLRRRRGPLKLRAEPDVTGLDRPIFCVDAEVRRDALSLRAMRAHRKIERIARPEHLAHARAELVQPRARPVRQGRPDR